MSVCLSVCLSFATYPILPISPEMPVEDDFWDIDAEHVENVPVLPTNWIDSEVCTLNHVKTSSSTSDTTEKSC